MTDHVLFNDFNKVETWIVLWEEIEIDCHKDTLF